MTRHAFLLTAAIAVFVATGGCPTTATTDQALTVIQTAAVEAAVSGSAGLASTTDLAQAASESEGKDQTAQSIADISFGSCPEITLTNLSLTLRTAAATLNFGAGCKPYDAAEFTWSGQAAAQVDLGEMTVAAQFDALTAGPYALDGQFDLLWERTSSGVALEGEWDFETTNDGATAGFDGAGTATFNAQTPSTLLEFDGALTYEGNTWAATLKDVLVSYVENANLIPAAGTVTITGTEVGTLSLAFDESSPKTGEIEVRINGGPAFPYTLAAFE